MASVKRYNNLVIGISGQAGLAAGSNLATNTTYATPGVPCLGARSVVFRLRTTADTTFQAFSGLVGDNGNRTNGTVTATYFSPTGVGYGVHGNVGAATGTNGAAVGALVFQITPSTSAKMQHKFAAVSFQTSATQAPTAVYVDAEVTYDGDADVAMAEYGQAGVSVFAG